MANGYIEAATKSEVLLVFGEDEATTCHCEIGMDADLKSSYKLLYLKLTFKC